MCIICELLDRDKVTFIEAGDILYSGEVPIDYEHFTEVLDKIDKKKESESGR